jgi:hypothetical protein
MHRPGLYAYIQELEFIIYDNVIGASRFDVTKASTKYGEV